MNIPAVQQNHCTPCIIGLNMDIQKFPFAIEKPYDIAIEKIRFDLFIDARFPVIVRHVIT